MCYGVDCEVFAMAFFVLPSAIGLHQTGEVISVYGNDFPKLDLVIVKLAVISVVLILPY